MLGIGLVLGLVLGIGLVLGLVLGIGLVLGLVLGIGASASAQTLAIALHLKSNAAASGSRKSTIEVSYSARSGTSSSAS